MQQRFKAGRGQMGLSLVGFIFVISVVAAIAVLGLKVVPTVVEYAAVKKAIVSAKTAGASPQEIKSSFDKQRDAGYIESVSGKDLEITRNNDGLDVSVAYQKKIELFGPVSLVIDYLATTGKPAPARKIE
jgi:Tfp pilus assembly major pilin PilA